MRVLEKAVLHKFRKKIGIYEARFSKQSVRQKCRFWGKRHFLKKEEVLFRGLKLCFKF